VRERHIKVSVRIDHVRRFCDDSAIRHYPTRFDGGARLGAALCEAARNKQQIGAYTGHVSLLACA
jgi:hypothetical protein